ncbi:MAG: HEAT repeat domain-containing protein [Alphaproteobacteria bacterium]|uniref:HEAT repeat domain-containing protein n=1 Tax=Candidatus Nitrobium versatile TaxID=2884831 RepID=A0A953J216_9BACT|nr:HEAT repeat domain-containing protein [Candidatus Nitrobium versatile]
MADHKGQYMMKCSLSLSSVLFFIISLFPAPSSAGGESDRLLADLTKPSWQSFLASPEWMAQHKDDASVANLSSLIFNRGIHWKIRIRVLQLLGETLNPKGIGPLAEMLTDPVVNSDCPALKWNSAFALGNFRHSLAAGKALLSALAREDNTVVREAIIDSLGRIGDSQALPALVPLLRDRSFAIRLSAIKAIGEIGGEGAVASLKIVLDTDSDPHIKNEAKAVLKRLGGARS